MFKLAARTISLVLATGALAIGGASTSDFQRLQLSDTFYGEGASFGDIDGDGAQDVVSGPFWYAGPEFEQRHLIHEPVESDPLGYSDDFFVWVLDVDGDGRNDVFKVGFPGKAAVWYQNPGVIEEPWPMHVAFRGVDNESPTLADIDQDGRPELVCNHGGSFGYASADWDSPQESWTFRAISPKLGKGRFTHGLGVGDVNGDGRVDLVEADGWWEQPESLEGAPLWTNHPHSFSVRGGGAQMYVYDIDGDDDADVLTSLFAHGWGLSWFEQRGVSEDGEPLFIEHSIMDREREANPWGVRFSSLHALDIADMDGDGLQDLVTGKRHWSHGPDGDPKPSGPSVLYWFRLERTEDGARFVPHLIDDDSGVGTQVVVGDIDGNGRPDVIVGNKQGTFLHLQGDAGASIEVPPLYVPTPATPGVNEREGVRPKDSEGRELNLGFESGDLTDWTAVGDAFEGQPVRGDSTARRGLESSDHVGEFWIGGYEIHGDGRVGELLSADFEVSHPWASFLVAGGSSSATRVEVVSSQQRVLFSSPGPNYEPLRVAVVDLREHQGERIHLRVIDEELGGWGHVNFDDFLFHEAEPVVDPARRMIQADQTEFSGLAPEEAARAMTVPEGFHVDLIAAEPDLHQPIALAIDGQGRLWVAEAYSYPRRVPDEEARDRILVFEDLDHDGSFETRTVFTEGLNLISGLEVGLGGVWVGAAPYLMFIPDRDDDLVPDGEPEIRLDGWEWQDTHETLNALTFGPDGWLYGCHGVFTHSRVGVPGTPDEERTPINCGVWRYHPERHEFEVFAFGTSNPWGLDFDEMGQAFITACVIPHLFHVVQGARYIRQAGSHFDSHAYHEIDTIADHLHWQGDTPWEGTHFSGSVGGGHAHCGAMIYLGDSFPEEYRGRIFMNNVHGNRINADSLERRGSGFVGRHEADLLLANDSWFRGINMKYGPDGAVYFIDWSDEQACHSNDVDAWTRSNGRMYRLRYGGVAPSRQDIGALSSGELVALQASGDEFSARRARLELQSREDPDVGAELLDLLRDDVALETRLRALWSTHVCGLLTESVLLELLDDQEQYIVAWAIQLACEEGSPSDAIRARLVELAGETSSPVVTLYLASALQRIVPDHALAEALLARDQDAEDSNILNVLWYALDGHMELDPGRVIELTEGVAARPDVGADIDQLRRFVVRRAAAEDRSRGLLVRAMLETQERHWRDLMLEELDEALRDARNLAAPTGWAELYSELVAEEDEHVRDLALWIAMAFDDQAALPELILLLLDSDEDEARRLRALESVATSSSTQASSALRAVLGEASLRAAAIRGLSASSDEATPPALLAIYSDLPAGERDDVLATLSGRESHALALLTAVEEGLVPREELSPFVLRKLGALQSPEVDATVARVWGVFRESAEERVERIADWTARFSGGEPAQVRLSHGREVFEATCAKCHVLFDEGGSLGPDLTGSNRADAEYLWTNVLDPNAVIGRDYQVTIVRTFDGLVVTGVLVQESESSITLATETDEFVVAREDIEERVLSDISAMPEGQGELMSERDRRDLAAYMASPDQVPLPLAASAVKSLSNGVDLTGWSGDDTIWSVEEGAIVGRTQGLEQDSVLVHDVELKEFRLSFRVMLEDDRGGSGLQFWSRVTADGDVAGYQAGIGPEHWGALHEVHGRGVLADVSVGHAVSPGNWNFYEVEATEEGIRIWINGESAAELADPEGALTGRLSLKLKAGGPTTVRFRDWVLSEPDQD